MPRQGHNHCNLLRIRNPGHDDLLQSLWVVTLARGVTSKAMQPAGACHCAGVKVTRGDQPVAGNWCAFDKTVLYATAHHRQSYSFPALSGSQHNRASRDQGPLECCTGRSLTPEHRISWTRHTKKLVHAALAAPVCIHTVLS